MTSRLTNLINAFTPDISLSIKRFPVETCVAACLTVYLLLLQNDILEFEDWDAFRIFITLFCAFFWSLAVNLFAQGHHSKSAMRYGVIALGIIGIALAVFYARDILLNPFLFATAILLLSSFTPYLFRKFEMAAFWQFNHKIWLGAIIAAVGAALFAGGVSLIIWTLNLLFGVKIFNDYIPEIWIIALGFIAPINWLALIPQDLDEKVAEGEQKEFTSYAIGLIVKFILIPLLLAYTLILYAYAGKILLQGEVPSGHIAIMVLLYGIVGSVTYLFTLPTCAVGPLNRFFWNSWFLLTVGPVILLGIATYQRIEQYGITTDRYLLVLFGVWLTVLALINTLNWKTRDLRLLPGLISLFFLIASVGPWGANGLSLSSQISELQSLLEKNDLYENGKVIPVSGEMQKLASEDYNRVRSILWYLIEKREEDRIAPWFESLENSPFPMNEGDARHTKSNKILAVFGVRGGRPNKFGDYVNFSSKTFLAQKLDGFEHISGPFRLNSSERDEFKFNLTWYDEQGAKKQKDLDYEILGFKTLTLDKKVLTISLNDQDSFTYNIYGILEKIHKEKIKKKEPSALRQKRKTLFLTQENSEVKVALMVQNLTGYLKPNEVRNLNMTFWLLVGKKEKPAQF